jgi:pimeloyl-ACP methyl ester carboxylesterase
MKIILPLVVLFLSGTIASAQQARTERVSAETGLDWVFAMANQSPAEPPAEWLEGYTSTEQSYSLYVPQRYQKRKSWPLVIFISPGNGPTGFAQWKEACQKNAILFASPSGAGNNVPAPRRIHIIADVLDDIRRKYNVDTDRTYIGGHSGGGRIACSIAFALPEYFGGVIPVCAGGELRSESWLRQRVIDRLSIAQLTGETDFNRGEVNRMHQTRHASVGVRCKTWVVDGLGHSIPNSNVFTEAFAWLEDDLPRRRKLAKDWPASRISDTPTRSEWAARLTREAESRLKQKELVYSGLMQLKGIHARWNDLPQAKAALRTLTEYDSRPERPWDVDDIAEQRRFLIARARGVDAYASGEIPRQYQNQREAMLQAAINLWAQVFQDGQDKVAVAEARERIPKLKALLDGE